VYSWLRKQERRPAMRRPLIFALAAAMVTGGGVFAQTTPGWEPFAKTYDGSRPVLLTGEVLTTDFSGSRGRLTLADHSQAGTPTVWTIDGGAKVTMRESGLTEEVLKPGVVITVRGYQAKDGSNLAMARDITFPDGRKVLN
jgi:hypothetical protein